MVFGCLRAPVAAPLRIWDRSAGCSAPPRARTPWAAPSWSRRGGFRAGKGCGQTGSEACPWVRLRLFLADETPGLQHDFLAFCPGHPLSILALALREGFGDGGVGAHFNCSGNGSNSFCGCRNPAELAACREFFHSRLSCLNSVTSRVSEPMLGTLPPSSRQGRVSWLAFGLEPCPRHRLCVTYPRLFWGRNTHLVGSGVFLGQGGVDRRGQRIPPVQAGIVLLKTQGF